MIVCKCIEKFKDANGKIYGYKLQDINGGTIDVVPKELKEAIKSKQVEVINLTLTSDNRLIDNKNKKQDILENNKIFTKNPKTVELAEQEFISKVEKLINTTISKLYTTTTNKELFQECQTNYGQSLNQSKNGEIAGSLIYEIYDFYRNGNGTYYNYIFDLYWDNDNRVVSTRIYNTDDYSREYFICEKELTLPIYSEANILQIKLLLEELYTKYNPDILESGEISKKQILEKQENLLNNVCKRLNIKNYKIQTLLSKSDSEIRLVTDDMWIGNATVQFIFTLTPNKLTGETQNTDKRSKKYLKVIRGQSIILENNASKVETVITNFIDHYISFAKASRVEIEKEFAERQSEIEKLLDNLAKGISKLFNGTGVQEYSLNFKSHFGEYSKEYGILNSSELGEDYKIKLILTKGQNEDKLSLSLINIAKYNRCIIKSNTYVPDATVVEGKQKLVDFTKYFVKEARRVIRQQAQLTQ